MTFEKFDGLGEPCRNRLGVLVRAQIARDADQTDNRPGTIPNRQFRSQAPSWSPTGIPMQLQTVEDRFGRTQDPFILRVIQFTQLLRKNLPRAASQQFMFFTKATSVDQGLVDREITAMAIFQEKRDFRHM